MERQAKDGTVYKQVGEDKWSPVTRTAKDGTVYKKIGADSWSPLEAPKYEKEAVGNTAVRKGLQGATGGLLDEASGVVEAGGRVLGVEGLGGQFSDIKLAKDGPTLDSKTIKDSYEKARDRKREVLQKDFKDNPGVSVATELAGGFANPVNKITKGMSLVKGGATMGAQYGFGNSEADNVVDLAKDTAIGAGTGMLIGKGIEKVAPIVGNGAKFVGDQAQALKRRAGETIKDLAENVAFKSSGAMLKDFRVANAKGKINEIGRWMLDRGVVKAGSSVDDVAAAAAQEQQKAALILDEIYNKAGEGLSNSGKGFDPLRDKERILAAAKEELGDTVGGDGVLNQLSSYIDDLAAKHGDKPNKVLQSKFKEDVFKYKFKLRQYLKDRAKHKEAFGNAADDEQQLLNGFTDDSQRGANGKVDVEVNGKPAEQMSPEVSEYGQQMELVPLPQAPQGQFNAPRGDSLLPRSQKMVLDKRTGEMIRNQSEQGVIEGIGVVPKTVRQGEVPTVQTTGRGQQAEMAFQPNRPARPIRPDEVRNPMTPRRSNEIKGAFDDQINYSRNPIAKEPAREKVFSGARTEVNKIILESIDSIDDKVLGDALRSANKEYGNAAQVARVGRDRALRESANKAFGLTDTIAAGAGGAASVTTGSIIPLAISVGGKKLVEKYGTSTLAVGLDRLSKRLLADPKMSQLAKVNPQAFNATVIRMADYLDKRGSFNLPKAASNDQQQSPTKGPDKWVIDGVEKVKQSDSAFEPELFEELKKTKRGKELLIKASDLKPGTKAMENLIKQMRTSSKGGE